MASSIAVVQHRLEHLWAEPHTLRAWLSTVDHKKIGKRYLVTALVFLAVGGLEAALMRAQLTRPEAGLILPETYNRLFTMHGVTMIFWYASPMLSGFANYLIPLMIGARDLAFPRLNAFWIQAPTSIDSATAMPVLGLSEQQARGVAAYLYTVK